MMLVGLRLPDNVKTWKDLQKHLWDRYHLDVDLDPESDNYLDVFHNYDLRSFCGWLQDFENFYVNAGMFAVPWDNTNANWQDGGRRCSDGNSTVDPGDIDTTPNYSITHISTVTIPTHIVDTSGRIS